MTKICAPFFAILIIFSSCKKESSEKLKPKLLGVLNVGDSAIDFAQPDPNGDTIRLSDITAPFVLVEFWASWCGPCRKENPHLIKIYDIYKTKGLEIIGVSLDWEYDKWVTAIRQDKLPWIQVSDLNGIENELALGYGVTEIPKRFLIHDDKIVAKDFSIEYLDRYLGKQLNEL